MKRRNRYSKEFQEQALLKARGRGDMSLQAIAEELNMSNGTLSKWVSESMRKASASEPGEGLPSDGSAASWSAEQRLLALNETHGLRGTELHAWCRERGLFEHQLQAWRGAFCAAAPESRESKTALRELQIKHDKLQRELSRKEKALAEAAALLVLQKKFQALWEGEEK
jgi:transposase-like protein